MENLLFLGVPKFGHVTGQLQCAKNIGTPNNHHFPFATNGKIVVLDVPILKHFRVCIKLQWARILNGVLMRFSVE